MRRVVIESPYAGQTKEETDTHIHYGLRAIMDCLQRNEAPIASHLLYTRVLDDRDPEQRKRGILAGFAWRDRADATVVYTDYGISPGMREGIIHADSRNQRVHIRHIGKNILSEDD